ncbi:MAG TPA: acetyltransferase [Solibacterales bacterium]|jgi:predicted GNAT superfamily acetyltransferase|nr:acetyltransferase [Bryobacterales bacterium]
MASGQTLSAPDIQIRALESQDDFRGAVQLQKSIWGFEDVDLLPARLFVVATKIGGHAFGAFHNARMVAFCLSIPGLKTGGQYYLHSHMLGVAPEYRNYGIGRQLKLQQREEALSRELDLMEWTFDPLELKNAYFNIERLGAVIRRYVRNQYGKTSSQLHGGLPTDRCTAEWWLRSDRVVQAIAGRAFSKPAIEAKVTVPADIEQIRRNEPRRAREVQSALCDRFEELFSENLAVVAFEKSGTAGTYCFGRFA